MIGDYALNPNAQQQQQPMAILLPDGSTATVQQLNNAFKPS